MRPSALCFGEILFDIFGDNRRVGGAPFNFAAHFSRLGGDACMLSAVGDDALGGEALGFARKYGINTDHIAVLPGIPTGYCAVTLKDGVPDYDLVRGVSYDSIPAGDIDRRFDMLYFGTLAQRSPASAAALDTVLDSGIYGETFFDVNIRRTSCGIERINELLARTSVLKFSREEAHFLGDGTPERLCAVLREKHPKLKLIVVTLDSDGAFAYDTASGEITRSRLPQAKVVSTVGAGDSFSAAFMYSRLSGKTVGECLENATCLAERICTIQGAIE